MRHHLQAVPLAVLLVTAASAAAAAPPAARPIADRDLGLSKGSVFDVPSPPAWHAEASAPGEKPLPPRASREVPPVVPHAVADFLPITARQNACVDCHEIAGPKEKGGPTPVPASHFTDLRRAPGAKGDKVAGARWACMACHVARTDAPPAVASTYKP